MNFDHIDQSGAEFRRFLSSSPAEQDRRDLPDFVAALSADKCAHMAAQSGRADILRALAEEHGANLHAEIRQTAGHGREIRLNLLDALLDRQLYNPEPQADAVPPRRVAETVEYLLQQGVRADLNADPLDNAVRSAYSLARPERVCDPALPDYDEVLAIIRSADEQAAPEAYDLIGRYQPEAKTALEKAFQEKAESLRTRFVQAQIATRTNDNEHGDAPRGRAGNIVKRALHAMRLHR